MCCRMTCCETRGQTHVSAGSETVLMPDTRATALLKNSHKMFPLAHLATNGYRWIWVPGWKSPGLDDRYSRKLEKNFLG